MAHLHRASQRRGLQDWSSVGKKKHTEEKKIKRANGVRGALALTRNVDASEAAGPLMCLCMSGCHMQSAAINIHAESLYYAAQLIDGLVQQAWVLSEQTQAAFPHPAKEMLSVSFTEANLTKETHDFV